MDKHEAFELTRGQALSRQLQLICRHAEPTQTPPVTIPKSLSCVIIPRPSRPQRRFGHIIGCNITVSPAPAGRGPYPFAVA
jgi:hypothetical protein